MENNRNTLIIVAFIVLIALFVYNQTSRKTEGYQQTLLPFNTEGIVYPHQNDKFYEKELAYADAVLGAYRTDKDIPKQSNVCSDTLKNTKRYSNCCEKCMASLENQENVSKTYYNKYRALQNKVANLENENAFIRDLVRKYRKQLGFCKRELTLNPVVQKCHRNYDRVANSVTGLGVETQFKQG